MTQKSNIRLGDLFPEMDLIGDFSGSAALLVQRISSVEHSRESDLVFISVDRLLPLLEKSPAAAFVVSDALWERASALKAKAPLLRSKDAMLAFAKVSRFFSPEPKVEAGIHPQAYVHPTAKIGKGVSIAAFAQVGEGAELGSGVILHSHSQVGARAKMGNNSVLFPGAVLYHEVVLGERVRIHANSVIGADGFGYVQERVPGGVKHVKIHHLGSVRIGDDVEIGASTTIDRGTLEDSVVGKGSIIDNQVQIGHNCQIGEGVIICGCVAIAGSVTIESYALIAGFTAIANKVTVGAGAQVAGFTAVTGHVPAGAKWGGNPAMPRNEFARLQVLFKKLPELFEQRKKKS